MNKLYLIIVAFLVSFSSFSQDKNEDAVYNKIIKEYTLHKDGTTSIHYTKELKLLSYRAFQGIYGESFIVYNPEHQKLKINKAFTIMADGKRVDSPENAFNEVLPAMSSHAPAYNHLREMVVTHTGLEVNSTIHLDYTLTSDKGYFPYLMDDVIIPEESPIKEYILIVKVPIGTKLQHKTLNIRTAAQITAQDNYTSYMWRFREIAAVKNEAYSPDNRANLACVIFSTAKNMTEAYRSFVTKNGLDFELSKSMIDAVNKTATSRGDELGNALKVQALVVNKMNHHRILPQDFGYKFRTPKEVWNSNGGTELEKAVLLASMIRKTGVIARPVAIVNSQLFDEKVGCLSLLDKFMVQIVPRNNAQFYLSVNHTDEVNQRYYLKDKTLILLDPIDEIPRIFTEFQKENIIDVSGKLNFDESALSGEIDVAFLNHFNPYLKIQEHNKNAKQYILNTKVESVEALQTTETKSILKYKISHEKPFSKKGDYYYYTIPKVSNGIDSWGLNTLYKERQNPVDLPSSVDETYRFSIKLSNGFSLIGSPANVSVSNKAGSVTIVIEQTAQELVITKSIKIEDPYIRVTEYQAFRELMNTWNNKKYSELVFKK